jgi:hypothetical protein
LYAGGERTFDVLLLVLRIALYLQLILGVARLARVEFAMGRGIWDTHMVTGLVVVVLALIVFRPLRSIEPSVLRTVARFMPIVPFAIGIAMFGMVSLLAKSPTLIMAHALLGLATIAVIEMAAGRQRRALRRASASR